MSKKTKSETTTTSERKSATTTTSERKSETTTKKAEKIQDGGYNPETWTEEWVRKNEEAKKLKGVSRPVDILPMCENDVTEAEKNGENV